MAKKYFILILSLTIYLFFAINIKRLPIEELDTVTGVGYDIEHIDKNEVEYKVFHNSYAYKVNSPKTSFVYSGTGKSIGEVSENKQTKINKKVIQGQEKVVLVSEDYARYGIKALLDERFRSSEFNDNAYFSVCKGKVEDYFNTSIKGFSSPSDDIYGILDGAYSYSFFSKDYSMLDLYVRVGAEGRNAVMPYIEFKDGHIKLTGTSVFNNDKMVAKVNLQDSKIFNLLRQDKVLGTVSLEKNATEYLDFYGRTGKRKVKCYKKDDKYVFDIYITIAGNIVSNTLFKDTFFSLKERKKAENILEGKIEKDCMEAIDNMKNKYKVDCLELGYIGASKFGRNKDIDWNKVVLNSQINVKVKVKILGQGRANI